MKKFFDLLKLDELNFTQIIEPINNTLFLEESPNTFANNFFNDENLIEEYFNKIEQLLPKLEKLRTIFHKVTFDEIIKLSKQEHLNFQDLNNLLRILELTNSLNDYYLFPIIPTDLLKIAKDIRNIIDTEANIIYENHLQLSKIRTNFLQIDKIIRDQITKLIGTLGEHLQMPTFDLIDNKYLLPIKSDHYRSNFGPIIYRSGSGHTLWVMPRQLNGLITKRLLLVNKEEEIINQITLQFSKKLHPYYYVFNDLKTTLIELDILQAKSLYIKEHQFVRPKFTDELFLENLYHPLIKNCIKNTIKFSKNLSGIIISGPNAGGKTVLLKSIALSYLFAYLGIFTPASKATLIKIDKLYFIGNKNQDINMGLSSFTAEASEYLSIITQNFSNSLIIIDEIFNSTASDEASHLALGIFNRLVLKGKLIVSTHHKVLKDSLDGNENFLNCHMQFDLNNFTPTYKLMPGSSKSSFALPTFKHLLKKFNLEDIFINDKDSPASDKYYHMLSKIEELEQVIVKKDKIINENTLKFAEEKREMLFTFNKQIEDLAQISPGIRRIQKKERLLRELPSIIKTIPKITPGEDYFSKKLNKLVTVIKVTGNQVVVKKGNMTLPLDINDLESTTSKNKLVQIDVPITDLAMNFDFRGMRLTEFKEEITKILDNLTTSNNEYIEIIHGFGVLRDWLLTHLKKHSIVFDSNGGSTRIYKN